MIEPTDGEAVEPDDDEVVTAITSDGVQRRRVSPRCPICTGGSGVACSWHFD